MGNNTHHVAGHKHRELKRWLRSNNPEAAFWRYGRIHGTLKSVLNSQELAGKWINWVSLNRNKHLCRHATRTGFGGFHAALETLTKRQTPQNTRARTLLVFSHVIRGKQTWVTSKFVWNCWAFSSLLLVKRQCELLRKMATDTDSSEE